MLRRVLFVSTLILAGTFGFANSAKAQTAPATATLDFSGTVAGSCTLTDPTLGTLVPNASNTELSSVSAGGISATVNISCTDGDLIIADPTRVGTTPSATFTSITAQITTRDGIVVGSPNNTAITSKTATLTSDDNGIAEVDLVATSGTTLDAGTYNFEVVVTATP